jgi:hypothetical protein
VCRSHVKLRVFQVVCALAQDLHRALANKDKPARVHCSGNIALSMQITVEELGPE